MFTEQEKVKIRTHLGYPNVAQQAGFAIGTPAALEVNFLIESAMNKVLPEAMTDARASIGKCDAVLAQIEENQDLLAVSAVDEITVRPDEFERLLDRYDFWRGTLANFLGVYCMPFDKRFYGRSKVNASVSG